MLATSDPRSPDPDLLELTMGNNASYRHSPTVRRRRLSRELRRLREEAGLTAEQVAASLEWAQSKVSGIETNKWKRPVPRDVRDLCGLYGADDATTEVLVTLARDSRKRGWWEEVYGDVTSASYVGFEAEARALHVYQPLVIPGLLQTPAYTRALARADLIRDQAEIDKRVELRSTRQKLLEHGDPLRLWAVIDEAALRRPFGTVADQREQLERLAETDALEHVTIQLLPFDAGMHSGLACGFVILTYEGDPSIVYIETGANALYLEKQEDLERQSVKFQHLQATALPPDATIRFISDMINNLK